MDIDARIKYSNIAVIRNSKTTGVETWPNPFKGDINISFFSSTSETMNITLTNLTGQILKKQSQQVTRGTTQIILNNLEGLASGVYLLKIEDSMGKVKAIEKLLKK